MKSLHPVHWFLILHVLVSIIVSAAYIATAQAWLMAIQGLFMLLGAFFFAYREERWVSVRALLEQSVSARHRLAYWATALLLGAVGVAAMAAYGTITRPEGFEFAPAVSPMLLGLVFGVWLEENNWRGYALPRLVKLHGPIAASLILSVFWSVWHLPFFFTPDYASSPFDRPSDWLFHLPFYFAGTFLMSWLGIRTRYSVLLAVVAHTSGNMVSEWFEPEWLYFAEMVGGDWSCCRSFGGCWRGKGAALLHDGLSKFADGAETQHGLIRPQRLQAVAKTLELGIPDCAASPVGRIPDLANRRHCGVGSWSAVQTPQVVRGEATHQPGIRLCRVRW